MKRKLMLAGFAVAAVLTAFFLVRAVMFALFWMDPERGLHPVEPWMTPRYIAHTYDIPRADLQRILKLGPEETPRMPLKKLAEAHGVPLEGLIAELEAVIAERGTK
ncbi:hypothetical protein [Pseudorhodobacter sp.]|uniref:hypothetical protein n=1 Tax=Pseudorhodobacter sp. TaxID=1934400 RepID=UPI002AFE68BD|nr:hypothetical protein [Pseudorhodobacter sp.]